VVSTPIRRLFRLIEVDSVQYGNESAPSPVSDVDRYVIILFPTYVRYSYAGGKREQTFTELIFHKVDYTRHDVQRVDLRCVQTHVHYLCLSMKIFNISDFARLPFLQSSPISFSPHELTGASGSLVGWGSTLSRKIACTIPDYITGFFQPYYGPGVDSASDRNEYQKSSWR
jgi:hypothetical protein